MAFLSVVLSAFVFGCGLAEAVAINNATDTCKEIARSISDSSRVIFPIQAASYADAISHWFLSSSDTPACVVKVASAEDVSVVLQIVGSFRTPFAVYSGGHASNPGFSSTKGVHISLEDLNHIYLSEDQRTVTVGFGAAWIDVYRYLEPYGLNIVGGRVIGPGVGGFTLGGGFSWKTNQHGLTVDTLKSLTVVLPNGTITTASNNHNQDLFFALKGGMNRFGIVTSGEFYTHQQPPRVYGGLRVYPPTSVQAVLNATVNFFYDNKDPRAGLITTLDAGGLEPTAMGIFFFDGPDKPPAFDEFDGIPAILDNVGEKTWTSFLASIPAYLVLNARGAFATVSTSEISASFLAAVQQEAEDIGRVAELHSGLTVSFDIEPFTDYGQHATESAYPHADSPLPLNLYFAWTNPAEDAWWHARMRQATETLKRVAIEEGIYKDTYTAYPNYALAGTTAEELYGQRNAARLRSIRNRIDPDRIMDLAGGFEL